MDQLFSRFAFAKQRTYGNTRAYRYMLGLFGWMVVRFVRVIRVPACARVSRVSRMCPGSPRCLFTGTCTPRIETTDSTGYGTPVPGTRYSPGILRKGQ